MTTRNPLPLLLLLLLNTRKAITESMKSTLIAHLHNITGIDPTFE